MAGLSVRKKLGFATAAILLGLVGLELVARGVEAVLALRGRPEAKPAVRDSFRPLRYDLEPGTVLPTHGAIARINSAGLRGAEPDRPKRRVRILCLGDSCTFGYAPDVTDDATYPADLARRLGPDRFEVLNGGRPGFGSLDCLDFFVYRAVELEPDYVLILAGWNDFSHAHAIEPRPGPDRPLDSLALVRLAKAGAGRLASTRPIATLDLSLERTRISRLPVRDDRFSEAVFARTERIIEDLVRLCRAHHAVPILVTYPNFMRPGWAAVDSLTIEELRPAASALADFPVSPGGWRSYVERTNGLIRAAADRLGVPLVDGAGIHDTRLFFDLIHLNAEGCSQLAERVAPVVLQAERSSADSNSGRCPPPMGSRE
jgi:lysophospholipase L1-like esterase